MIYAKQLRQKNRKFENQTKKTRLRCHAAAKKGLIIIDKMNISEEHKNELKAIYTPYLKK